MPPPINIPANLNFNQRQIRRQAQQAAAQVNQAFAQLNLNANGTQRFKQSLGRITSKTSEFQKSMDAATARVFAFGATAAVLNTVTQSFKALVQSTVEVQRRMIEIGAIIGGTKEQMYEFRELIFDVAKNTGQTFEIVADGAAELARQGLNATQTAERLNAALILTRISGLDSVSSVNALTAALNGFTSGALSANAIINKMVAVDTAFAVSSKDLAEAFQRAGSTAEDARVSFDELLGVITAVQQTTSRGGAVIGNALKSIFTRLSRGNTIAELQQLGVAIDASQSGIEKLKALSAALEQISDPDRASKIKELAGGVYQINIVSAALKDLSNQNSIFTRATSKSAGATNEALEKNKQLSASLSSQLNELLANITDVGSKIGELTIAPLLGDLLKLGNFLTSSLAKMLDFGKGSKVLQFVFSTIGKLVSGPGVVLAAGAFTKILKLVGQFAKQGLVEVFKIGSKSQEIKEIENGILDLLHQNHTLRQQIGDATLTNAQKQTILLQAIQDENDALEEQKGLINYLAKASNRAGIAKYDAETSIFRTKQGKAFAYGRGNNDMIGKSNRKIVQANPLDFGFSQNDIAKEIATAKLLGASANVQPYVPLGPNGMPLKVGGRIIMVNNEENISLLPGQDPFIIPNYKRGNYESTKSDMASKGQYGNLVTFVDGVRDAIKITSPDDKGRFCENLITYSDSEEFKNIKLPQRVERIKEVNLKGLRYKPVLESNAQNLQEYVTQAGLNSSDLSDIFSYNALFGTLRHPSKDIDFKDKKVPKNDPDLSNAISAGLAVKNFHSYYADQFVKRQSIEAKKKIITQELIDSNPLLVTGSDLSVVDTIRQGPTWALAPDAKINPIFLSKILDQKSEGATAKFERQLEEVAISEIINYTKGSWWDWVPKNGTYEPTLQDYITQWEKNKKNLSTASGYTSEAAILALFGLKNPDTTKRFDLDSEQIKNAIAINGEDVVSKVLGVPANKLKGIEVKRSANEYGINSYVNKLASFPEGHLPVDEKDFYKGGKVYNKQDPNLIIDRLDKYAIFHPKVDTRGIYSKDNIQTSLPETDKNNSKQKITVGFGGGANLKHFGPNKDYLTLLSGVGDEQLEKRIYDKINSQDGIVEEYYNSLLSSFNAKLTTSGLQNLKGNIPVTDNLRVSDLGSLAGSVFESAVLASLNVGNEKSGATFDVLKANQKAEYFELLTDLFLAPRSLEGADLKNDYENFKEDLVRKSLKQEGYTYRKLVAESIGGKIPTLSLAHGYVPNFALDPFAAKAEVSQAKALGARGHVFAKEGKGTFGGKTQSFVYNNKESVVHNFMGTGETAVLPSYTAPATFLPAGLAAEGFIPKKGEVDFRKFPVKFSLSKKRDEKNNKNLWLSSLYHSDRSIGEHKEIGVMDGWYSPEELAGGVYMTDAIDSEYLGLGLGTHWYAKTFENLFNKGAQTIYSDQSVSPDASYVYASLLKRMQTENPFGDHTKQVKMGISKLAGRAFGSLNGGGRDLFKLTKGELGKDYKQLGDDKAVPYQKLINSIRLVTEGKDPFFASGYTPPKSLTLEEMDGMGYYSRSTEQIGLNKNLSDRDLRETLLHEWAHHHGANDFYSRFDLIFREYKSQLNQAYANLLSEEEKGQLESSFKNKFFSAGYERILSDADINPNLASIIRSPFDERPYTGSGLLHEINTEAATRLLMGRDLPDSLDNFVTDQARFGLLDEDWVDQIRNVSPQANYNLGKLLNHTKHGYMAEGFIPEKGKIDLADFPVKFQSDEGASFMDADWISRLFHKENQIGTMNGWLNPMWKEAGVRQTSDIGDYKGLGLGIHWYSETFKNLHGKGATKIYSDRSLSEKAFRAWISASKNFKGHKLGMVGDYNFDKHGRKYETEHKGVVQLADKLSSGWDEIPRNFAEGYSPISREDMERKMLEYGFNMQEGSGVSVVDLLKHPSLEEPDGKEYTPLGRRLKSSIVSKYESLSSFWKKNQYGKYLDLGADTSGVLSKTNLEAIDLKKGLDVESALNLFSEDEKLPYDSDKLRNLRLAKMRGEELTGENARLAKHWKEYTEEDRSEIFNRLAPFSLSRARIKQSLPRKYKESDAANRIWGDWKQRGGRFDKEGDRIIEPNEIERAFVNSGDLTMLSDEELEAVLAHMDMSNFFHVLWYARNQPEGYQERIKKLGYKTDLMDDYKNFDSLNDNAIRKLYSFPEFRNKSNTLYRREYSNNVWDTGRYKPDEIETISQHLSASHSTWGLDPDAFGDFTIEFSNAKGKGVDLHNIFKGRNRLNESEEEVVIPRGTQYKTTKRLPQYAYCDLLAKGYIPNFAKQSKADELTQTEAFIAQQGGLDKYLTGRQPKAILDSGTLLERSKNDGKIVEDKTGKKRLSISSQGYGMLVTQPPDDLLLTKQGNLSPNFAGTILKGEKNVMPFISSTPTNLYWPGKNYNPENPIYKDFVNSRDLYLRRKRVEGLSNPVKALKDNALELQKEVFKSPLDFDKITRDSWELAINDMAFKMGHSPITSPEEFDKAIKAAEGSEGAFAGNTGSIFDILVSKQLSANNNPSKSGEFRGNFDIPHSWYKNNQNQSDKFTAKKDYGIPDNLRAIEIKGRVSPEAVGSFYSKIARDKWSPDQLTKLKSIFQEEETEKKELLLYEKIRKENLEPTKPDFAQDLLEWYNKNNDRFGEFGDINITKSGLSWKPKMAAGYVPNFAGPKPYRGTGESKDFTRLADEVLKASGKGRNDYIEGLVYDTGGVMASANQIYDKEFLKFAPISSTERLQVSQEEADQKIAERNEKIKAAMEENARLAAAGKRIKKLPEALESKGVASTKFNLTSGAEILESMRESLSLSDEELSKKLTYKTSGRPFDSAKAALEPILKKNMEGKELTERQAYMQPILESLLSLNTPYSDTPGEIIGDETGDPFTRNAPKLKNPEIVLFNPSVQRALIAAHGKEFLVRPPENVTSKAALDKYRETAAQLLKEADEERANFSKKTGGKTGYIDLDQIKFKESTDDEYLKRNKAKNSEELRQVLLSEAGSRVTGAIYGAAGSGKTSLAESKGSPILELSELDQYSNIIDVKSTANQALTGFESGLYKNLEWAMILSSSTEAEKAELMRRREYRDQKGTGLFGREIGSTLRAPTESIGMEAVFLKYLGKDKTKILGLRPDFGYEEKRGDQLPEITNEDIGLVIGAFSPATKGHLGMAETLRGHGIEKVVFRPSRGASPDIKDLQDEQVKRTIVLPRQDREFLLQHSLTPEMLEYAVISRPEKDDIMGTSRVMEMPSKDGKRIVNIAGPGSIAISGIEKNQGKANLKHGQIIRKDQTGTPEASGYESYLKAGYDVLVTERQGGISGTGMRDALINKRENEIREASTKEGGELLSINAEAYRLRWNKYDEIAAADKAAYEAGIEDLTRQYPDLPARKMTMLSPTSKGYSPEENARREEQNRKLEEYRARKEKLLKNTINSIPWHLEQWILQTPEAQFRLPEGRSILAGRPPIGHTGHSKNIEQEEEQKVPFFSYSPHRQMANSLEGAIRKEIASGVPPSAVRVVESPKLAKHNTLGGKGKGLAVTNVIDEPMGLGSLPASSISAGHHVTAPRVPNYSWVGGIKHAITMVKALVKIGGYTAKLIKQIGIVIGIGTATKEAVEELVDQYKGESEKPEETKPEKKLAPPPEIRRPAAPPPLEPPTLSESPKPGSLPKAPEYLDGDEVKINKAEYDAWEAEKKKRVGPVVPIRRPVPLPPLPPLILPKPVPLLPGNISSKNPVLPAPAKPPGWIPSLAKGNSPADILAEGDDNAPFYTNDPRKRLDFDDSSLIKGKDPTVPQKIKIKKEDNNFKGLNLGGMAAKAAAMVAIDKVVTNALTGWGAESNKLKTQVDNLTTALKDDKISDFEKAVKQIELDKTAQDLEKIQKKFDETNSIVGSITSTLLGLDTLKSFSPEGGFKGLFGNLGAEILGKIPGAGKISENIKEHINYKRDKTNAKKDYRKTLDENYNKAIDANTRELKDLEERSKRYKKAKVEALLSGTQGPEIDNDLEVFGRMSKRDKKARYLSSKSARIAAVRDTAIPDILKRNYELPKIFGKLSGRAALGIGGVGSAALALNAFTSFGAKGSFTDPKEIEKLPAILQGFVKKHGETLDAFSKKFSSTIFGAAGGFIGSFQKAMSMSQEKKDTYGGTLNLAMMEFQKYISGSSGLFSDKNFFEELFRKQNERNIQIGQEVSLTNLKIDAANIAVKQASLEGLTTLLKGMTLGYTDNSYKFGNKTEHDVMFNKYDPQSIEAKIDRDNLLVDTLPEKTEEQKATKEKLRTGFKYAGLKSKIVQSVDEANLAFNQTQSSKYRTYNLDDAKNNLMNFLKDRETVGNAVSGAKFQEKIDFSTIELDDSDIKKISGSSSLFNKTNARLMNWRAGMGADGRGGDLTEEEKLAVENVKKQKYYAKQNIREDVQTKHSGYLQKRGEIEETLKVKKSGETSAQYYERIAKEIPEKMEQLMATVSDPSEKMLYGKAGRELAENLAKAAISQKDEPLNRQAAEKSTGAFTKAVENLKLLGDPNSNFKEVSENLQKAIEELRTTGSADLANVLSGKADEARAGRSAIDKEILELKKKADLEFIKNFDETLSRFSEQAKNIFNKKPEENNEIKNIIDKLRTATGNEKSRLTEDLLDKMQITDPQQRIELRKQFSEGKFGVSATQTSNIEQEFELLRKNKALGSYAGAAFKESYTPEERNQLIEEGKKIVEGIPRSGDSNEPKRILRGKQENLQKQFDELMKLDPSSAEFEKAKNAWKEAAGKFIADIPRDNRGAATAYIESMKDQLNQGMADAGNRTKSVEEISREQGISIQAAQKQLDERNAEIAKQAKEQGLKTPTSVAGKENVIDPLQQTIKDAAELYKKQQEELRTTVANVGAELKTAAQQIADFGATSASLAASLSAVVKEVDGINQGKNVDEVIKRLEAIEAEIRKGKPFAPEK